MGDIRYLTPGDRHCQEKPKSQYRGVYWDTPKNGWVAILYQGENKYSSVRAFSEEWHAALFFDVMVFEHGAPRKLLNFPEKAQEVEQRLRENMVIPGKPQLKLVQ